MANIQLYQPKNPLLYRWNVVEYLARQSFKLLMSSSAAFKGSYKPQYMAYTVPYKRFSKMDTLLVKKAQTIQMSSC